MSDTVLTVTNVLLGIISLEHDSLMAQPPA